MARSKRHELIERIFVPCASFTPERIALYSRPIDGFRYSSRHAANQFHLEKNDHEGKISLKARRKIERALTWLLFLSRPKRTFNTSTGKHFTFKVNFVTLTLPAPQVHTDQEITERCLNNFLTVLRKYGCKHYLWRAEAQPSTGNIHFHLTTDTFLPHDKLRQWWNQSVSLLGYIDSFQLKHGHRNPNSTDVHSVKHVKKLACYLSKYLGKNVSFPCVGELRLIDNEVVEVPYNSEQYHSEKSGKKKGKVVGHMLGAEVRKITSRLWGCSSSLSRPRGIIIDGENHTFQVVQDFIQQGEFHKFESQYVSIYFGDVAKQSKKWFPQLYNAMLCEVEGLPYEISKLPRFS